MAEFNYASYQEALQSLKEKTQRILEQSENQSLVSKLDVELDAVSDRKQLTIAFVGQYSSGKSTIISAMTGNKHIKIDANVATDRVTLYTWYDIILMDTPGILAGKFEQHDKATKEALKESDLIFYVLTSQLFDDVIFNNFIDLAYNQHLADKMFLVVNKMGMESGEYEELVKNYTVSLQKTFTERGYSVDEFPIAFIDANDYIEGVEELDTEFVELSHFNRFLDMLNTFVQKKGWIKKQFDTLVRILQSYLKDIKVIIVDSALCDFYKQFEQKLTNSQKEIKRDVAQVLYSFDTSSMNEVLNLSNEIGATDEQTWIHRQNSLNARLDDLIREASTKIEATISESYNRLIAEMQEFGQKESIVKYAEMLEAKIKAPTVNVNELKSLTQQLKGVEVLRWGASRVSEMAPGVNKLLGGIRGASGSSLHEATLTVGHFFGKSFKPWQAVRWASNIAKVAKFGVPVIVGGVDIYMQLKNDKKETEQLNQIKAARSQFVTGYQSEVNQVKAQFEKYLGSVMQNYTHKRDELNESKDQLLALSNKNLELEQSIKQLEGEYVDFLEIINDSADLNE